MKRMDKLFLHIWTMPFVLIAVDPPPNPKIDGPIQIGSLIIPVEHQRAVGIGRERALFFNTYRYYVWMFGRPYRTSVSYERRMPMLFIPDEPDDESALGTVAVDTEYATTH